MKNNGKCSVGDVSGQDWSPIDNWGDNGSYSDYFVESYGLPSRGSNPFNLGLYYDIKDNKIHSERFVGVMPLLEKELRDKTNEGAKTVEDNIFIRPRFNISASKMLEYIMKSNDFYESKKYIEFANKSYDDWKNYYVEVGGKEGRNGNKTILCGVYKDLPEICLSYGIEGDTENYEGFANLIGIFEIWDFISKAKVVCRKMLKQQSQRVEENFVGKVKGRIDIQKQIKTNLAKGRLERTYCSYNKLTIDNMENRILKYALYLCDRMLEEMGGIDNEDAAFCRRKLAPVTLQKCSLADFKGIKNNGVFKFYGPALESAKRIISRISVSYNSNQEKDEVVLNKKVRPFFIRMDLLFELYCRALISNALENYDQSNDQGRTLKLEPYAVEYKLFGKEKPDGFDNIHIPDIVISSYSKEKNEWKPISVLDAKYAELRRFDRFRSFQVLAYMLRLNCSQGGFMSPSSSLEGSQAEKNVTIQSEILGGSGKSGVHIPVRGFVGKGNDSDEEMIKSYIKQLYEINNESKNVAK